MDAPSTVEAIDVTSGPDAACETAPEAARSDTALEKEVGGGGGPSALAPADRVETHPIRDRSGGEIGALTLHFTEEPDAERVGAALHPLLDTCRLLIEFDARQGDLERSEERLSLALASSDQGIWDWVVPEDRVVVDPRWCTIVGVRPGQLTGTISDWVDYLHPDDAARTRALFDACLLGDRPSYEAEYRVVRPDGSVRWVLAAGRVVARDEDRRPLRMAGTFEDRTERMSQSLTLERLRAVISNLNDAVVITEPARGIDDSPEILFVNPAVSKILGIDARGLVGRSTVDFFGAARGDETALVEARRILLRGEPVQSVLQFERPDGTAVWMEVLTQPIEDPDPAHCYWVSVARDITDRIQAEQELADSRQRLRHAQKMEAVGRLAGGMAHDFNNLLTAILGYGEFIADEVEDEGLRQDAQEIVRAAIRGQSITRQLLAFSRKSSWSPRILPLAEILGGIDRMVTRLVGEDVHVSVECAGDVGCVEADPAQLEQAIVNLAINARDALRQGGSISIAATSVELPQPIDAVPEPVPAGEWEVVEVRDTGTGIAPGLIPHIFEPFFTTKPSGKGTGLGLASVYGTVKQSGGYASVESTPGEGSIFRLYLPRREAPADTKERVESAVDAYRGTETILVVEDENAVRNFTVRALERAGYSVVQAKHGADALLIWEREGDRLDLVLTDVVMPEMDGVALADGLASRGAEVPVLFMSGYTGGDTGSGTARADIPGPDLVPKPFGAPELLARVRERLDRTEGRATACAPDPAGA